MNIPILNSTALYDGKIVKIIRYGIVLCYVEFTNVFKGQRMYVKTDKLEFNKQEYKNGQ